MRFHVFKKNGGGEIAIDLDTVTRIFSVKDDSPIATIKCREGTYCVTASVTDVVALLQQPTPSADEYQRELAEACGLNRADRETEQTAAGTNIEARIIAARLDELCRLEECFSASRRHGARWLSEYFDTRRSFIQQGKDGPSWEQLSWSQKMQNAIAEGEA